MRRSLERLRRELDPDTTGGAILLGLRGVAVIAHGSSGPQGIANAIRLAERSARERVVRAHRRAARALGRRARGRRLGDRSVRRGAERDRTGVTCPRWSRD